MATYAYVVGAPGKDTKEFADVRKAAEAFRRFKASSRPYVIRVEKYFDGREWREAGSVVANTTVIGRVGNQEYGKWAGSADDTFKRAYEASQARPTKVKPSLLVVS